MEILFAVFIHKPQGIRLYYAYSDRWFNKSFGLLSENFFLHVISRTWSGVMLCEGTEARIKVSLRTLLK